MLNLIQFNLFNLASSLNLAHAQAGSWSEINLLGFIDLRTLLIIGHVLGVIIGMGAAFTTDAIFFSTVTKSKVLTPAGLKYMKVGSRMVWLGLAVIVIFGLNLFATNPAGYLASDKFLAKMTIVAILIINGTVFHFKFLPILTQLLDQYLPQAADWRRFGPALFLSGAVSTVSWLSAFILGSLHTVPYSYGNILAAYLAVLIVAGVLALIGFKLFSRE